MECVEWVAVRDELPEENQEVFYFFDVVGVSRGHYLGECEIGSVFTGDKGYLSGDVTHWQPDVGQDKPEYPKVNNVVDFPIKNGRGS